MPRKKRETAGEPLSGAKKRKQVEQAVVGMPSAEVRFTRLMLLHTLPMYWEPRPVYHSEQLRDFLIHLLDPQKPGYAAVLLRGDTEWKVGNQAISLVRTAYERLWLPLSRLLKDSQISSQQAFQLFDRHKMEIFLDSKRFLACCKRQFHIDLSEYRKRGTFYIGLSIDWSHSNSLVWSPQLRISNFWPISRKLAPEPPQEYAEPSSASPSEAAGILEDWFWKVVQTDFTKLRYHFGLSRVDMLFEGRQLLPPVFYYAEPDLLPTEPEALLEFPHRSVLETLCQPLLGTQDPRSADVAGAVLENNLFTLRREIVRSEGTQAYYLILPWWQDSSERVEVERELVFVADKWFFVEFALGFQAYDLRTGVDLWASPMRLWGGTLSTASEITSKLHNYIAFVCDSQQRRSAFRLAAELRATLARLESSVLRATSHILKFRMKVEQSTEKAVLYAKQAFTSRPLPRVKNLLDAISEFFVFHRAYSVAGMTNEFAERLRDDYAAVESALQELNQREAQEQKEREEEARRVMQEREERNQRRLNKILAILAGISALPILIGQLNWNDINTIIETKWKNISVLSEIGGILKSVHPWLVFIAIISVSAAIIYLLYTLFVQQGSKSQGKTPPGNGDELPRIGQLIVDLWRHHELAEPLVQKMRLFTFVSRQIPGHTESDEILDLRRRVHQLDIRGTKLLHEIWEQMTKLKSEHEMHRNNVLNMLSDPEAGGGQQPSLGRKSRRLLRWREMRNVSKAQQPDNAFQELKANTYLFIALTELFDNRPVSFCLPLCLCVFRYKSTEFVQESIVSDFEFEQVLNTYGYTDEEVRSIDDRVNSPLAQIEGYENHSLASQGGRVRDLPVDEFVRYLSEKLRISATRNQSLELGTGEEP
jgi:molecular chaperone GrpE (heat shock protein)